MNFIIQYAGYYFEKLDSDKRWDMENISSNKIAKFSNLKLPRNLIKNHVSEFKTKYSQYQIIIIK